MPPSYSAILASPIGNIGIKVEENQLVSLAYLENAKIRSSTLTHAQLISNELTKYFSEIKAFYNFSFKFNLIGTPFQKRVWQSLLEIPVGSTKTYGQIASKLKTSARAVGNACRANPIPIIVPCHRVVSAQGLGGYCGQTNGTELRAKSWLINHEHVI
ncbi:MAG: methylated-DNA--[protein]-cysteine S-methyltransferase [Gammaproteobacteria bacterium]